MTNFVKNIESLINILYIFYFKFTDIYTLFQHVPFLKNLIKHLELNVKTNAIKVLNLSTIILSVTLNILKNPFETKGVFDTVTEKWKSNYIKFQKTIV